MCEAQDVCEKEKQTRILNDEELRFLADWAMMSVKFSLGKVDTCLQIWSNCLLSKDGELLMKKKGESAYDKIKIDKSDGDVIISVATGSSFVYYGTLVE